MGFVSSGITRKPPPIKKWSKTKERVLKLLKEDKKYSDDLNKVICTIWWNDMRKLVKEEREVSFHEFIVQYLGGNVTPVQTITRTWRKLQEQYIELRGKNFESRHKTSKEVQSKIFGYVE